MQNSDVFFGSKWNTAAVVPERLCVPRSPFRQRLTRPNRADRRAAAERRKARDGGEQDKCAASYAAPLVHFCPQCGQFTGDRSGVKIREKTAN